jgi:hypothetical protein
MLCPAEQAFNFLSSNTINASYKMLACPLLGYLKYEKTVCQENKCWVGKGEVVPVLN